MKRVEEHLQRLLGSRALAKRLLAQTTLRHLAHAPLLELELLMPRRAAARFHAALALARAVSCPKRPRRLSTPEDIACHLHRYLVGHETERMVVVACDASQRPVATEIVATGSPISVSVHIADLFALAVRHRAPFIALGHNHPSGDPTPSAEDRMLTGRVVAAGILLGITVVDHIIVADNRFASLSEDRVFAADMAAIVR